MAPRDNGGILADERHTWYYAEDTHDAGEAHMTTFGSPNEKGSDMSALDALLTPPDDDTLGVLTSTARVVRESGLVALDLAALSALGARWADVPWPEAPAFSGMHYSGPPDRLANWVLLLDALNFSFWGMPGEPRWQIHQGDQTLDGYAALAAALTRAAESGTPLWDADYLATMPADDLARILRPTPGAAEIPLFAERLANAREVGRVLNARYNGQFERAVIAMDHDAARLALLLARDFPSFNDTAEWDAHTVSFLKRAQITVADLHAATNGTAIAPRGLERLTAFADYKLPQLLRAEGVLVYAPELADLVDSYTLLPSGSRAEVEIRAATIWSVELLRRALESAGVHQTASAIDYRLWHESQSVGPSIAPYHRTRTIYY